jgi:hypothetical protein
LNRIITYSILSILLLTSLIGRGQEFHAVARLDSNTLLIGDQVNMKLSFSLPAKAQVLWPSIKDTILGKIQVIDRTKVDTAWSADKKSMTLSQKLRLTCFDSGFYTIPPIRFYYRVLPDTTVRFEQSDLQVLTVHTLQVDTTQAFKPIKGPIKIPVSWVEYLKWIFLGLVFIAIVGFFIYYLILRKKGEPVFSLKPKIKYLPHEKALMELEKLRVKKLWQTGKVKEYYTELTDILRRYIEDRFGMMALESTTAEILEELSRKAYFPSETRIKLGILLSSADLVKFAKQVPTPDDNETSMNEAVYFITSSFPLQDQILPESGQETTGLTHGGTESPESKNQKTIQKVN